MELSYFNNNAGNIARFDGTLVVCADAKEKGLGIDISDGKSYNCSASLSSKESYSMSGISLINSTQEFVSTELVDTFKIDIDYDFVTDPDNLNPTFPEIGPSVYQIETTQTIVVG